MFYGYRVCVCMSAQLACMICLPSLETVNITFFFFLVRRYVTDFFYLIEEGEFRRRAFAWYYSFGIMASGLRGSTGNSVGVDRLRDEMKDMKIGGDKVKDMSSSFHSLSVFNRLHLINVSDLPLLAKWELHLIFLQEMEATVVDGNVAEAGHIIVTTISGKHGDPKQVYF